MCSQRRDEDKVYRKSKTVGPISSLGIDSVQQQCRFSTQKSLHREGKYNATSFSVTFNVQ